MHQPKHLNSDRQFYILGCKDFINRPGIGGKSLFGKKDTVSSLFSKNFLQLFQRIKKQRISEFVANPYKKVSKFCWVISALSANFEHKRTGNYAKKP
jgi:hypothetical protein